MKARFFAAVLTCVFCAQASAFKENIRQTEAPPCTLSLPIGTLNQEDLATLRSKGYALEIVNTLPFVNNDLMLSSGSYFDPKSNSTAYTVSIGHLTKGVDDSDNVTEQAIASGATYSEAIKKLPSCDAAPTS